ncbi:bifunctional UDP-N-acetylglucosamine diphosphorylase/glucosamine-1-phosphate N-acetyltransferase GlmU [Pelagibius litoralis]|uniref:Bifunctional protein GlmU n=1 Tax=Pelagibius litoralis TaxID=374515 RepID=A0A967K948_9PROT|nr:bifunctional UDP-N-acetylglucosamine diphosphorylase/glucosamine-1-phosphate N-acetyltransferase GlmU [Pelagibius litoralis]NIA69657.1 bifunctional UDP-N-acetylglucosamine diphosphorylase/glucosamine-1-phosphate N-acetyltransferase GlmU [Pelagibius litoralis]
MSDRKLAVVILAAGKGSRMKSDLPKVLHPVAGRPMLRHVQSCVATLSPEETVVVIAPGMADVEAAVAPSRCAVQNKPLGTGHAVAAAREALQPLLSIVETEVLVVFGDTPLLTAETLSRMVEARAAPGAPEIVGLAFRPADPAHYGRVILDDAGRVEKIVEFADADSAQRQIDLCNAGIVIGSGRRLFDLIERLGSDNAQGEYYLTDIFGLAHHEGRPAGVVECPAEEVLGVNSRADLALVEGVMQDRLRRRAMDAGVTLIDPASVWFSADTMLGRDVTVHPSVFFGPGVTVGDRVEIRSFCHLEGAKVSDDAILGPFARLRPGARLGEKVHVGNFVEIKNAELGAGAKANHLSYIGDASVGAAANIGAGTITCNYDGFAKHRTTIGAGAFIGSNTALVAPVDVGPGALVGAGSTITRDVPSDALAVARGEQQNREGRAASYRAEQKAKKAEKDGHQG